MLQAETPFYLLGMGDRTKLMYKEGRLSEALTGRVIAEWQLGTERIVPEDYMVNLVTADGEPVTIFENESGVYIRQGGAVTAVTESGIRLPDFAGHPYAKTLRILHQDILVNICDGLPVPNFFIYKKPWYRDAAMMAMCLERTGNVHLIRNWIEGLREPFDLNNAGHREPDNIGQALYLVSLVSDRSHPLVGTLLGLLPEFEAGSHIEGMTDFAVRPVYQTKWLKLGLKSLGLPDPYVIPDVLDEYSDMFWMDFREEHVEQDNGSLNADNWYEEASRHLYPYLLWAKAHFYGWPAPSPDRLASMAYPISWEKEASQADYEGLRPVSALYEREKYGAPHTWHAAEMFLYLLKLV